MSMVDLNWPTAFYLAPLESVLKDPDVLFRLVRPTPPTRLQKNGGIESAAGLVNVIPQRRVYRMETLDEIEVFKRELLKRPLVLQCLSTSGIGLTIDTCGCAVIPNDTNWVLLINQTHPKVLGRIQMGTDAAKNAMYNGAPFVLRFSFGSLLQRLHRDLFEKNDIPEILYNAKWDFAELVVRFPGQLRRNRPYGTPECTELTFDFRDIDLHEIKLKESMLDGAVAGPVTAITEDEIRDLLPGWTVNEISPLDNIGEARPETYTYAQAGRLYESFRKKKRQKNRGEPSVEAAGPNAHVSRRLPGQGPGEFDDIDINEEETTFIDNNGGFMNAGRENHRQSDMYAAPRQQPVKPPRKRDTYPQDGKSPFYPEVSVVNGRDRSVSNDSNDYYLPSRGQGLGKPFGQSYQRNSDRSTDSTGASSATGADSGYYDDGYYSNHRPDARNGQFSGASRGYDPMAEKYGNTPSQRAHDNYGFHEDENDAILQKHKQFVNQILHKDDKQSHRANVGHLQPQTDNNDCYLPRSPKYLGNEVHGRLQAQSDYGNDHYSLRNPRSRDLGYEGKGRSHAYSTDNDLPSYGDVTSVEASRKFAIQGSERTAESFI